ncbi:hypothetical protein AAG906_035839 [Vitis piasezkii]
MKYVWIEESPNTASDCGVAPPKKGDGLRSRRGTTRKVEEHFPRHVQGLEWRKSSRSFAGKTVWRADGDKNSQKRRSFWYGRCRKNTSSEKFTGGEFSEFLALSSNILAFLSPHITQINAILAFCHRITLLLDLPNPL